MDRGPGSTGRPRGERPGKTRKFTVRPIYAIGLLLFALVPAAGAPQTAYGINLQDQLVSFNVSAPGAFLSANFIQGLMPNDHLVAIDFRPSTNVLYGLGSLNRLYEINLATASAAPVGLQFAPLLNGTEFSMDFNPVTDQLTVISNLGQSLSINPNTGQATTNPSPTGVSFKVPPTPTTRPVPYRRRCTGFLTRGSGQSTPRQQAE